MALLHFRVYLTAKRGFGGIYGAGRHWAIFPGEGAQSSIQELEKRIVTEWLPTSGYEYGSGPDLEVYLNPDPQHAQYEVWIPVVKKQG